MSKFIMVLSFLALGTLLILSAVSPGSSVMWLAANSLWYNLARILLMAVLFILVATKPPRNKYFRYFVGLSTLVIGGVSLGLTYHDDMQLLDTASILVACISMGITVLEFEPEDETAEANSKAPITALKHSLDMSA